MSVVVSFLRKRDVSCFSQKNERESVRGVASYGGWFFSFTTIKKRIFVRHDGWMRMPLDETVFFFWRVV